MKKLVVLGLAAVMSSVAWGQDYAGLTLGRSKFGGACPVDGTCKSGSLAGKILVGAGLEGGLRSVGLSSYELSYVRFGRTSNKYSALLPTQTLDSLNGDAPLAYGDYDQQRQSTAMVAAFVARYAILPTTVAAARFGLAYVSASATTYVTGSRNGQVTESHFKPYLGLGLEQQVLPGTKVTAGVDWTKYTVAGTSGSLMLFGLGVLQDF